MLIPVFRQLFGTSGKVTIPATADREFLVAITQTLDRNAARALNDQEGELWQIFVDVLQACLVKGRRYAASEPQPH